MGNENDSNAIAVSQRRAAAEGKKWPHRREDLMEANRGVKCASDNSPVTSGVVLSDHNENLFKEARMLIIQIKYHANARID